MFSFSPYVTLSPPFSRLLFLLILIFSPHVTHCIFLPFFFIHIFYPHVTMSPIVFLPVLLIHIFYLHVWSHFWLFSHWTTSLQTIARPKLANQVIFTIMSMIYWITTIITSWSSPAWSWLIGLALFSMAGCLLIERGIRRLEHKLSHRSVNQTFMLWCWSQSLSSSSSSQSLYSPSPSSP